MTSLSLMQNLRHMRALHGDWTGHNIELAPGLFTIAAAEHRQNERIFHRALQVAQDMLRRPLAGLKVLDLGCLEGGFTIEFARHGADCLGVEPRLASIEKARFAAQALQLTHARFLQEDVRNLTEAALGQFDVVLCWGLLYHLQAPDVFEVLKNLKRLCRGVLIIDTHVSIGRLASTHYEGCTYWGSHYPEHDSGSTPEQMQSRAWASMENLTSFWLTRASLFNFLDRIGFTSIFENASPMPQVRSADRITVAAVAGQAISVHPQGTGTPPPSPTWREEDARFCPTPADAACSTLH